MLGVLHAQGSIADLAPQEALVILIGFRAVDLQGVLALFRQTGVESWQIPNTQPELGFFISTMERFMPAFRPWLIQGAYAMIREGPS